MRAKGMFLGTCITAIAVLGWVAVQASTPIGLAQTGKTRGRISGQLRDEATGRSIEGFISFSMDAGTEEIRLGGLETDEDGNFILPSDLPYGPIFVIGAAINYGRAVAFLFVERTQSQRIELLLPLGCQVEGFVTDPFGNAINDAKVTVEYEDRLRDRLSQVPDVTARATEEGFQIITRGGDRHGGSPYTRLGSELKPEGQFIITDIDPNRPFKFVSRSEVWGEVTSETMTLIPGEMRVGIRLSYGGQ